MCVYYRSTSDFMQPNTLKKYYGIIKIGQTGLKMCNFVGEALAEIAVASKDFKMYCEKKGLNWNHIINGNDRSSLFAPCELKSGLHLNLCSLSNEINNSVSLISNDYTSDSLKPLLIFYDQNNMNQLYCKFILNIIDSTDVKYVNCEGNTLYDESFWYNIHRSKEVKLGDIYKSKPTNEEGSQPNKLIVTKTHKNNKFNLTFLIKNGVRAIGEFNKVCAAHEINQKYILDVRNAVEEHNFGKLGYLDGLYHLVTHELFIITDPDAHKSSCFRKGFIYSPKNSNITFDLHNCITITRNDICGDCNWIYYKKYSVSELSVPFDESFDYSGIPVLPNKIEPFDVVKNYLDGTVLLVTKVEDFVIELRSIGDTSTEYTEHYADMCNYYFVNRNHAQSSDMYVLLLFGC